MIEKLLLLSRSNKKLLLIIIDTILLITVLFISYSIRLDQWYFPQDDTIRLILFAPVISEESSLFKKQTTIVPKMKPNR